VANCWTPTVRKAFADCRIHQIAHVYVSDPGLRPKVRKCWKACPELQRHL